MSRIKSSKGRQDIESDNVERDHMIDRSTIMLTGYDLTIEDVLIQDFEVNEKSRIFPDDLLKFRKLLFSSTDPAGSSQ